MFSSSYRYQPISSRRNSISFCCYLHHQFFNQQRLWAGHYKIPAQQQALSVSGHAERHLQNMRGLQKILFLCLLTACEQTDKSTNSDTPITKEKVFYVETKNFGIDIQSCFSHTLFNKWSDTSFMLHENEIIYKGKDLTSKHAFLDIKSFTPTNTPDNVEKIKVIIRGDLTVKNTIYSIERFSLQDNGDWKRIADFGSFKTFDRPNDFISPSHLDVDEICDQLVQKTVETSYK
jgi:hypothetical protein